MCVSLFTVCPTCAAICVPGARRPTCRSCRRHTVESRGLGYVAELAVLNCMDLVKVLLLLPLPALLPWG